ncbi:hypothetical protein MASR2M29_00400 [Spirochaetota bacterium]
MGIFRAFFSFLSHLFGFNSSVSAELKQVYASISYIKPPYYKMKGNLVTTSFAQDLFLFCKALKPLMDLADRTLAHPDVRVSMKYFEFLVDLELPAEVIEKKDSFAYDGMKSRMDNAVQVDEEDDIINRDFQNFLNSLDSLNSITLNSILSEVERFIEICRHDWERVLAFFDPAASLEDNKYKPSFEPCMGEQLAPELMDIHYLLDDFVFSDELKHGIKKVLGRYSPVSASSQTDKIDKIFSTLAKIASQRLSGHTLLSLVRLTKQDSVYFPDTRRDKKNYIDTYRKRIVSQYNRDRERLLRERHETVLSRDIKDLFGSMDILAPQAYSAETDAFLRKESTIGFDHVKAMSILKTYVNGIFETQIKEPLKKLLVEGFFEKKDFQNNLANILFQISKSAGRINDFETELKSSSRISIETLKRYVEEFKRGKDIEQLLIKLVKEINYKANDICKDETNLFQMLAQVLDELLDDYKQPGPDLISNIRNIGGPRNKEIFASLAESKKKTELFIKIMKNLSFSNNDESLTVPLANKDENEEISEAEALD